MSDEKPVEKNYITPAGYRKLADEFDFLRAKKRPEVVSALGDAAAEGDRSENAEYIYRKKELREIDRRIGYLQRRLPTLKVVTQAPADPDRVYFGATVALEAEDGTLSAYRIVGPDEAGPEHGRISVDSPMARALLKRAIDEEVLLRTGATTSRYVIVDIRYE